MLRFTVLFLTAALFLSVIGCGSVSVASKPSQRISKDARITVVAPPNDPQNIVGQLEHLLLTQGFEVTSEAVGEQQIEYKEAEATEPGRRMTAGTVTTVKRLPTDLVLRFSYNAYFDVFYWSFTRFNGTVIDIDTGRVVASVSFSGDRSVSSVLTDFAKQLGKMSE